MPKEVVSFLNNQHKTIWQIKIVETTYNFLDEIFVRIKQNTHTNETMKSAVPDFCGEIFEQNKIYVSESKIEPLKDEKERTINEERKE